ncbi:hypothetical protein CW700_07045 [Candidatus Bathyarchaeota archaeon]|nr:MAG: hypothetical protein CW700_07045 [Candidatus Bathyarchaeota archaeon]
MRLEGLKSPVALLLPVVCLIRREVVYFEEGGPEHTETTIDLAFRAAKELGIGKVVVASTTGESGVKVAERFRGTNVKVIVVGHQFGYPTPGQSHFKPENLERLRKLGAEVYLGTDVLTNSIRRMSTLGPSPMTFLTRALIMAGVKVNVEVVVKAADAGLVMPGERVISLAGSHWGLDTAVVIEAQDSVNILKLRVRETIAMPLSRRRADEEYMKRMRRDRGT